MLEESENLLGAIKLLNKLLFFWEATVEGID